MEKIIAIVQARMGSTRFPGKVLKKVNNQSLIQILLSRLSKAKNLNSVVVAISDSKNDDPLAEHINTLGYDLFRGSENDVLARYYEAAKRLEPDAVVRITGDCPLIDPTLVDSVIEKFFESNADYASNIEPPTYPDGLDIEVFKYNLLKDSFINAKTSLEREHVTTFIRNNKNYNKVFLVNKLNLSNERWTVDEPEDFEVISQIIKYFQPDIHFNWEQILELKSLEPSLFKTNQHIKRNEGATMGKGQKLYKKAKKIIPGGTMLLSKRPEMFLPDYWPSYYSKSKGCKVWDLDNNEYIDMSVMGIGTNILGYGHQEVDNVVKSVIENGNMSTLNCAEEVFLAEKLIALHPWADMVRFARSGGEANAIAIRIARAAVGKETVAICGYHGWHDWYLAANLDDDNNLDGHLLPGLDPTGVPRTLRNSTVAFKYNDLNSLQKLIDEYDIGVIKMEVSRSEEPRKGFLESIREIATKENIILIFDECTSGFRETYGGLHKKYGINPDIAVFGKALGNGYAITSVIGKREVMDSAQNTFISSTFWTERIGVAAGLKTLEVMQREKSWEKITKIGKLIGEKWALLGEKYGLPIQVNGLPSLINFTIPVNNWIKYKTLITQEMLKKGYLATNTIYVCIDHKDDIINEYFYNLENIFSLISECENGKSIDSILDGPASHSGFKRLN